MRALLDEVGAQAVKVVPLFNRLLHCTVERALQVQIFRPFACCGLGNQKQAGTVTPIGEAPWR